MCLFDYLVIIVIIGLGILRIKLKKQSKTLIVVMIAISGILCLFEVIKLFYSDNINERVLDGVSSIDWSNNELLAEHGFYIYDENDSNSEYYVEGVEPYAYYRVENPDNFDTLFSITISKIEDNIKDIVYESSYGELKYTYSSAPEYNFYTFLPITNHRKYILNNGKYRIIIFEISAGDELLEKFITEIQDYDEK